MRATSPWRALSLAPVYLVVGMACAGEGAPSGAPAGLQEVLRAARADAAQLTGLRAADIEVVSAEPVTWRDGSLGCPQPGRMYTMALVPGYRVVLRAQGREYRYHAGMRGAPLLCPEGRAVDPLPDDRR